jgi:hypothetical protein
MRRISTVVASVFRFEASLRREGARGQRIAVPAPVVRGLRHTGWDGAAPLRAAINDVAWTGHPRKMGRATVLAVPPTVACRVGDVTIVELWRPGASAKRYHED